MNKKLILASSVHRIKYYLRHSYKPHNLETLDAGIRAFWKTMTPDVCRKYIGHIQKVMPSCGGQWKSFRILIYM